jgi:hypothetical protein
MAWGSASGRSKVRLNYTSLKQAIVAKGNRGNKGQVHCHGNVWARHDVVTNDIILKLHRTDIITYHPNGERSLQAKGWHTPLTHYWFSEANIIITSRRANDWTKGTCSPSPNRSRRASPMPRPRTCVGASRRW